MQKSKILNFINKNKYKILFVVWLSIIFTLSSIPNLKSNIPGVSDLVLRKIAHFVEYFILMFLCIKSFCKEIKINYRLILCFIFCSLYALSDEMHQFFVPTRHFALFDFGIDNLGLISSILFLFIYNKVTIKKLEK
ncbi:MAG TPA: VanZ family protein [bacterium]|nr:VanZ family protein [bacterium]